METTKKKMGRPKKEFRERYQVFLTPEVADIMREYSKYVGCAMTTTMESAIKKELPMMLRTLGRDA